MAFWHVGRCLLIAIAVLTSLVAQLPGGYQDHALASPNKGGHFAGVTINIRYYPDNESVPRARWAEVDQSYVANVLPNEWFDTDPPDALRAGAIMIRGVAYWEISRRWGPTCHSYLGTVEGIYGYWDTTSHWDEQQGDQRWKENTETDNSLAAAGVTVWKHLDYDGDYIESTYAGLIGTTVTYADQGLNFEQIVYKIYDERTTGGCSPRTLTVSRTAGPVVYPLAQRPIYRFDNPGDTEGWTAYNYQWINPPAYDSGAQSGAWIGQVNPGGWWADPQLLSPSVSFPSGTFKYLVVRMADQNTSNRWFQLYWDKGSGFSEALHTDYDYINESDACGATGWWYGWYRYVVDLPARHSGWTGTISQVRFDPVLYSDGRIIGVDYIEFRPYKPC